MRCPRCQSENAPSARVCTACEANLQECCPKCGSEIVPTANFCFRCGAALPAGEGTGTLPQTFNLEAQFATLHRSVRASLAPEAPVHPEDQNRPLTILFADMSGSVARTYHLDPEDTAALLNEVLKIMVDAIHRHGGRINSFLGDGVLAFFGAPQAHEDDPERAIRAALEIREGAQRHGLNVTAGINSGVVYLGKVGSTEHQEFAARGRAINLAARLQTKAQPGQILVGEPIHRLARRAFEFVPLAVEMKGVPEPVAAYQVVRPLPHAEKARGIEGVKAPLVGREEQLAALTHALAETRQGRGQMLALIGDAGIGKSRLVAELKQLTLSPPRAAEGTHGNSMPRWLEGRCLEQRSSTSYAPFLDILQQYFAWHPADDDRVRASRLARSVQELVAQGALAQARRDQMVPLLGNLLSVKLGAAWEAALTQTPPEQLKQQTVMAIVEFFAALATRQPVVLVLEDLHWADGLSLEVLPVLMGRLGQLPLLLLCVYRPVPDHPSRQLGTLAAQRCPWRYAEIHLSTLSAAQSSYLVEALLRMEDVPASLLAVITQKAQGNPFFLEELVRSLIEAGVIYRDNGSWRARERIEADTVPEAVQTIILSRVDRLDDEAKQVLQTAAVIGRLFRRRLLGTLRGDDAKLDRILGLLEDREMIYQDRLLPEMEYSFKHVLIQETVYANLLRRQRAGLHREVAQAMEALYQDTLDEYYEQLANHYGHTEAQDRALYFLERAAGKARRLYANGDALRLLERALGTAIKLGAPPPDIAALHRDRGEVHQLLGAYPAALTDFEQGLALAQQGDDRALEGVLENRIGLVHHRQYQLEDAKAHFARAESLARESGDRLTLGQTILDLASLRWDERTMGPDDPALSEGLALLREMGDRTSLARGLNLLCMAHLGDANGAATIAAAEEARAVAQQGGDKSKEATSLSYLSITHVFTGRYRDALKYGRAAITLAKEIGDRRRIAYADNYIAQAHWALGEWGEAIRLHEENEPLLREVAKGFLPAHFMNLGMVYYELGDVERAKATFRSGLDFESEGPVNRHIVTVDTIYLARLNGDADALKRALDSILVSPSLDLVISWAPNYWVMFHPVGEGLLETGRIDDLRRWVDTCRPIMEKLGSPEHLAELAILEANLAIREGRIDEGQAHLDQAIRWSEACENAITGRRARELRLSLLGQPEDREALRALLARIAASLPDSLRETFLASSRAAVLRE